MKWKAIVFSVICIVTLSAQEVSAFSCGGWGGGACGGCGGIGGGGTGGSGGSGDSGSGGTGGTGHFHNPGPGEHHLHVTEDGQIECIGACAPTSTKSLSASGTR